MRRLGRFVALAVIVAGVALAAAAATWAAERANRHEAARRFDGLAARLGEQIVARMRTFEYGLRGLRGAVVAAGGEEVTRQQILAYSATRDIEREFPGARGFGVILRVPPAAEAGFLRRARRDWPDFTLHRLGEHEGAGEVLKFVEPLERNRAALGLDIASEPGRHQAALASVRNGGATLTAPIGLVQETGVPALGFLLLLPIYRPGAALPDSAAREAAAIGWSVAPLVGADVFKGLDRFDDQISLRLADRAGSSRVEFFSDGEPGASGPPLLRRVALPVYGRVWEAEMRPTAAFTNALDLPDPRATGLAAGLLAGLSALAAWLSLASVQRRKRDAQEMARRSAIVESSEDAIVAESLDGVITEWNRGAERLFGYSAAQALGQVAAGLVVPPQRSDEDQLMRAIVARGERLPAFDTTCLHRDGTLLDVSITAAPLLDAQGRCVGFAKTLRDIRESRAAQRALSQLNDALERQVEEGAERLDAASRNLRAVLDAVPSMIGYWDRDLTNRVANRAYADWFALQPEQLQGQRLPTLLGEDAYEALRPHVEAALQGQPQTFERAMPERDGRGERHCLVHYLPDWMSGQVQGFYVLVHDITEVTRNQRALARAQRENAAILETLHRYALVSVADGSGRIMDVNDSFCRVSGYTAQELRGQNHRIVNSAQHDKSFWREMWRTISSGAVWRGEVCNRAKDGTLYWVDSVIAPFLDERGQIEKYVSIRTDITPTKRLQKEAEDARFRATLASHAKSQFLANMSHEIRTPMNAVIGLTYLLQRTPLSQEQAGFAGKIGLAGKALLALIDDVLDLSKIEACEMHLESVAFSLRDILSEVSAIVGAQAGTKGIAFAVDIPRSVPDGLVGDPTRVRQVLLNLLGNSLKFTERGRVRLEVRALRVDAPAADGAQAALEFRVLDTGIGIDSAQLERLFQPFVQADTSTTRRFGGTGLGLSIVRQLLELMGGSIEVRSQLGAGSEFTARIAFAVADADAVLRGRAPSGFVCDGSALAGLSLLVVDDSEINLEVARRILQSEGASVELAHDGREAVERLRKRPDEVDLVLMDVQMPVMDGHDATRRIRGELGLARLPIVALTAGMTTGERERAAAAGMNDMIGKPFEPEALVACILRAVGSRRGAATGLRAAVEAPAPEWPRLEGIDHVDAGRRMGGDVALLRILLAHFIKDTEDIAPLLAQPQADAAGAAMRLHNLKGVSATLGAKAIAHGASTLEQACLLGTLAQHRDEAERLSERLQALRGVVQDYLKTSAAPPPAAAAEPPSAAAAAATDGRDEASFGVLLAQLRLADLQALQTLQRLAQPLRQRLGGHAYAAVRAACEDLQFGQALALLEARLPALNEDEAEVASPA